MLLDRFGLAFPEAAHGPEMINFARETRLLHVRIMERCHGSGGVRDGARLGVDGGKWLKALETVLVAVRSYDPAFVAWWEGDGVRGWPQTIQRFRASDILPSVESGGDRAEIDEVTAEAQALISAAAERIGRRYTTDTLLAELSVAVRGFDEYPGRLTRLAEIATQVLAKEAELALGFKEVSEGTLFYREVFSGYVLGRCLLSTASTELNVERATSREAVTAISHCAIFPPGQLAALPEVSEAVQRLAQGFSKNLPEMGQQEEYYHRRSMLDDGLRLAFAESWAYS